MPEFMTFANVNYGTSLAFVFFTKCPYLFEKTMQPKNYTWYLFPISLDVDECKEIAFICGLDGICINKNGSYDCVCPEGQKPNANDKRCEGK